MDEYASFELFKKIQILFWDCLKRKICKFIWKKMLKYDLEGFKKLKNNLKKFCCAKKHKRVFEFLQLLNKL